MSTAAKKKTAKKKAAKPVEATPDCPYIAEGLRALAVPIAKLQHDPANVRKHSPRNLEAIKGSLARFGQRKPIVAQAGTHIVTAGNGTLDAARALGWLHLAVLYVADDPATATAFAIADNRTAELAEWDDQGLAQLLQSLDDEDRAAAGFDDNELDDLLKSLDLDKPADGLTDPDEVPPVVPEEVVTKPGDIWILGDHRLMCGSSTVLRDVDMLLGGAEPLLMVTDPPYGVEYDASWRNRAGLSDSEALGKVANDDEADWTAAWELFPGRIAYVWHGALHTATVAASLAAAKMKLRAQVIWVKNRPVISRGHYHWQHEPALVVESEDDEPTDAYEIACYAVRAQGSSMWAGGRKQSTLWEIDVVKNDTGHSTQKPVECMERPIRNHGRKGDAVYEPFSGSGTTIIACERTGRRCYAMEIDPLYVDTAVKRWEAYTGRKAVRQEG